MIEPFGDRVVIKPLDDESTTPSGLVIPDVAREKPQTGEVVAVGPGELMDEGHRNPMEAAVGDRVLFSKFAGTEIKLGADLYLVLSQRDILGRVV